MTLRELITRLSFRVDDAGLDQYRTRLRAISADATKVGKEMQKAGAMLSLFVTTPLVLLGNEMRKLGSDAKEIEDMFSVVFSTISTKAEETAKKFAKDFDLADSTSKQLLANTGDLLQGWGFTPEKALEMAVSLNSLAGDLNSMRNIEGGTTEASRKLTSGILGEMEALKSLGIVIRQDDPAFKERIQRIQEATGATAQQAKAEAILAISYEQSTLALGNLDSTRESSANREKKFLEQKKKLLESFGKILDPYFGGLWDFLNKVAEKITNLSPEIKKTILVIGGIAIVIGPLLVGLGTLVTLFGALGTTITAGSFTAGLVALKLTFLPLLLVFAKFLLIATAVWLVIDDIVGWTKGKDSVTGMLLGDFDQALEAYKTAWREFKQFFVALWNNDDLGVWTQIQKFGSFLSRAFEGFSMGNLEKAWKYEQELAKTEKNPKVRDFAVASRFGGIRQDYFQEQYKEFKTDYGLKIDQVVIKVDGSKSPEATAIAVEDSLTNVARQYRYNPNPQKFNYLTGQ